jgi:NAD(P)-dependent dehydrogenase (short-subunit alcohol dehydrogenase family)
MKFDFNGKTVLVTGGSNGIGNAAARLFGSSGAKVYILDAERAEDFGPASLVVDVRDATAVDRAVKQVGHIDVAVINAGIAIPRALFDTTDEVWTRTLQVNLTGAFYTLRAVAAQMKEQRGGAVVFTASTNSYDGEGELTAYNATKAGVLGLVHTAANELGPYRIRVNAVCPGLIRTRITEKYFGDPGILRDYFRDIPLGRGGEPSEVAAAIAFLASDAASFITGAALLVDGGQMATKFGPWNDEIGIFEDGKWSLR